MAEISFVDQTIRDGQQSLWGMRMRAGQVTAVAKEMDSAGFHIIDIPMGGTISEVAMRYLHEDTWERMDHLHRCLPRTRLRAARRPSAIGRFAIDPDCVIKLWVETLVRHGISSFWIYDCLYNMEAMERVCRTIADTGSEVVPAIMFGISPVHTDEFFAETVRQYVSWGITDAIFVEDAPGILTPDRTRTLVRGIIDAADGKPVELHCHNTTGMAPANYLVGIEEGVRILHTASRPLANGPSLPSIETMIENLNWLGHTHGIDTSVLPPIADHMERVALQEGHPVGVPADYSVAVYQHQLPGGMTGTLKAQLAIHHMEDRLQDVLVECAQVRQDLGHPISATPFSQFVGIQAVLNVTTGDRYSVVPREIVLYVLGHFGNPPAPLNQDVLDRIMSSPQAKELLNWEPPQPTLRELRAEYGGDTDEELLTRYLVSPDAIEATRAAGPFRSDYEFRNDATVRDLLGELKKLERAENVTVKLPDLSLSWSRATCAE